MRRTFRAALGLATILISSQMSQAATITFFGQDLNGNPNVRLAATPFATAARTSFLSNLVGVGTESFETFATGAVPGAGLALTFSGAGTATLTAPQGTVENIAAGTNGVGRYPTDGNQFIETNSSMMLVFSQPTAAFGFVGTDIGDFGGILTLNLINGGVEVINIGNAIGTGTGSPPDGSVLFFGVIANTDFTSITFNNSDPSDFFGYDQMTIGGRQQVSLVPVPPSAILMGLGGLGFIGNAWRRRKLMSV